MLRRSAEKLKTWFVMSGRTVIVLAALLGGLFLFTTGMGILRRGQTVAYAPINLMNGSPMPPPSVTSSETPAGQNVSLLVIPTALPTLTPTDTLIQPITDIPGEVSDTPPTISANPASGSAHVVAAGETLYRIALQYNLTPEDVAAANGLTDTDIIYEGQTLLIPVTGDVIPALNLPAQSVAIQPTESADVSDLGITTPVVTPVPPDSINGVAVETFAPLNAAVIQTIRTIYAAGQGFGRNPRTFSKLGDSTIENPHFLTRFDDGPYTLGDFAYLQPLIDQFAGSFSRQGLAVQRGLHTWSVLDPMWASGCTGGDHMLLCEFKHQNPSFVIIHLTTNDAGVPESTERSLREITEFCIINGVVPILGTKADRQEGSNINNEIIRRVAGDYNVPLWDFDLVAGTLPGRGLDQDGIHMTSFFAHDWGSPVAYQRGYGVMNITALIAFERVWRAAVG